MKRSWSHCAISMNQNATRSSKNWKKINIVKAWSRVNV